MATKYQRITSLYDATIKEVTHDAAQWTAFLRSACRNYKCRFDEQILIYAQRPHATAVLEIDKWNKQFGRWVNKGATGIAVFDDEHNGNYRLKHYFDVSDTHGSRFERPIPIWGMKQHFEVDVIESLENSFGALEDRDSLAEAIISVAKNAVEDNMPDYLRDLMYAREDSFLEELDELNVEVEYRTVIQNSVAYMMLTRCGLNADQHFEHEDFHHITDFNTRNTINAIGIATSDITEMCLREIATTVINLQKEDELLREDRTFASSKNIVQNNIHIDYNINLENNEGSFENDRSVDISHRGRLSNTQLDSTRGNARNPWQIRISEETIPQTEPTSAISEPIDGWETQRTFNENTADSNEPIGADYRTNGHNSGNNGGNEGHRPDEMGGLDEQHTDIGGGTNTGRTDIQLKPLPTAAQQLTLLGEAEEPAQARTSVFSISQQIIDEVLTTGGNENNSPLRIISYFKKDHTTDKNAVFLQKEYGTGGKGFVFEGSQISVWFKETGIDIAIGDSTLNSRANHITWEQAAKRTRELLDMGRYAPQSELDKADGLELKSLADNLWYTHQDLADNVRFSFIDEDTFRTGFPDSTAKIAELLAQPEQRNIILAGLREFAKEYAENPELLRFRIAERHLNEVLTGLEDLEIEPVIFTANEEISTPRPSFITQDEIDKLLMGGSGISEGHYRIYSYFLQEHSPKDKADFLKDEYGTGGFGRTGYNEWHDSKGISFSRENNFMPYDKVLLPWTKVARRIEELIADGRYMSKAQLEYIPEYEKGVLAGEIYSFYINQPEDIPRLYPNGSDYYKAKELIIQQLNEPERVAEILNQMHTILDGTADFDRNYERMQKAYQDLTTFQNGTYSLFKAVKNINEQKQEQNRPTTDTHEANQRQTIEPISPVISSVEYDLELGVTVHIGTTEYEIYSFDDNYVVLRDTNAPLFTREMPRDEFDRKLGENHLNDHLIKIVLDEPQANITDEVILGDKFYVDQENGKVTWVYFNPDSDAGGQYIYNEVYFDLIHETAGITSVESEFFDRLGSMAKQTLIDIGTEGFLEADRNFKEEPFDFADCNVATMNALTALANEALDPQKLVGNRYDIDGRIFVVNSVDADFNSVSLRDVTFQNKVGFPIFRSESIDFIRMYEPIKPQPEVIPQNTKDNATVSDNTKETVDLTPTWEKPKLQRSTQSFDAFPDIPMSERNNFIISDDDLGAGGAKTKYRYNVEAIKTLQLIESENRLATPTEQEILSRYVGWGGLADVFDETKSQWTNEYVELKSLLTQEEYSSARSTTLNAHYTSPIVIKAIYKSVENMGFKTGNILEPSCGIGNFLGLVPENMKDSKLFGIELDDLTGRIAQQLYQKSSIAIQGYEKTNLPDSFFDLAIGNVPFGGYGVVDKKYDKHKFLIHDFFFAKTLDKVRPGGVIAFITSKGTMDKENPAVRRYIAQRADLLGAIRLPNTAFKSNAGTEVTTDIIFLQKRDRIMDIEPDWVHLGQTEDGIPINSYFVEHPNMMLGTMSNDDGFRMYGNANSTACVPFPDTDLSELLNDAIQNIHGEFTEYERGEDEPEEDNSIPADPNVRNFSYALSDGQIYYRQDSRMVPVELPVTTQSRVKGMIGLRDCVRTLIEYQTENYPDNDIKSEQAKLNRLYDDFTRKYGLINSRGNNIAFSQDSAYCLLCSLEVIDENGELKRKADMFHKRTIKPHEPVTHVDTASEALALSISEKARVDLNYMSELTGMNEDALVKELEGVIFLNIGNAESQEKVYVTADEYLSGNVREKLAQALAAQQTITDGRYDTNVKALEAAQPKDLTAAEISVRLGATWVPPDVIQSFMYELLQTPSWVRNRLKVHYSQHLGEWSVTEKNADRSNIHTFNTYGTQRINAYKIIEESLNLRDVRIFDKVIDADGTEKRVLNKRETAIAQAKQEIIRSKFEEWIWKDPTRRERLCRIYNDKFNSIRPREYDGSHIKFVGMNPEITLRKHQINAIAHILYGGNTLLAHEVGGGKTYEMVAAAMESKRLGLCSKSLIVVPNHITEQWAGEFLQLYPSANILVATRKDFETKNRKKFCARIATGDYDAVIIGHSQFERIPMSAERQQRMLERQINELLDGLDELKHNSGERYTIKQMERAKKSLEVKLAKLNDQSRKDDVVTFEQLGVNRLFIDESHYYKNLYLITKMRNVSGIAQTEAQKSSDLFMKTQYLDEITGGRGTIFASGTPISNSMVEFYTVQRYLQYSLLVQNDLQHFDAWASTFGETVTAIELAPEGTGYRAKTRFAKFFNVPELMSMFKMAADIKTADMLDLPVPKVNFHTEVISPNEWQQQMVAELGERAEKIRNREVDSSVDNMLCVTNDGRKLALDQRIINPLLPDDPNGKVATCAKNVYRIWEETKEKRSTQIIFCDLSTPKGDGTFSVYTDIKEKLMYKGIPENEIAFIHSADTEVKKKELFAKVRSGHVRVLLGSTAKCGAGTNIQDRLIALHDLECPWRPSDLQQRLGRIVRQGNQNPIVEVFRYVTESTFDSYLFQLVENKQKFISQIMTSKTPVRMAEDVDEQALSYAEIKALATGNPLIIEKCQLEMDVGKLKILQANHLSQKYALEDKLLKEYPQDIKRLTDRIAGYKADIETITKYPTDKDRFQPMKISGVVYSDKKEAGTAIINACKAMTSPDPVLMGEYRGFHMLLSFDTFAKEYRVTMQGALTQDAGASSPLSGRPAHTVKLGSDIHGNITRLDNAFESFEGSLKNCMEQLEGVKSQMEAAKGEIDRPFPQAQEYEEKSVRLKELNILLNMDEKDVVILEGEPDEVEIEVQIKDNGRER